MGTTLTFIVAGILWLVYLVPALRRNREFDATEKNAIRLQQALRTFAQSTETRMRSSPNCRIARR